jgi:NAD(P)-dependent dehydrogenase (short-subunit alcohol dehydrogenase family)
MGKLQGKVALVTGSGRNIGRATVLHLAREGAHVRVTGFPEGANAEPCQPWRHSAGTEPSGLFGAIVKLICRQPAGLRQDRIV